MPGSLDLKDIVELLTQAKVSMDFFDEFYASKDSVLDFLKITNEGLFAGTDGEYRGLVEKLNRRAPLTFREFQTVDNILREKLDGQGDQATQHILDRAAVQYLPEKESSTKANHPKIRDLSPHGQARASEETPLKASDFPSRWYRAVQGFNAATLIKAMMDREILYEGVAVRFNGKPGMFRYVEEKFDTSFQDKKTLGIAKKPYVPEWNLEALIEATRADIDFEVAEEHLSVDKDVLNAYFGSKAIELGYKDAKLLRSAIGKGMALDQNFRTAFYNKSTKTISFAKVKPVIDFVRGLSPVGEDGDLGGMDERSAADEHGFPTRPFNGEIRFDVSSLLNGMLQKKVDYKGVLTVLAGKPDLLDYLEERAGKRIPEKETLLHSKKAYVTKETLDFLVGIGDADVDPGTAAAHLRVEKADLIDYLARQAKKLGYPDAMKLSNGIQNADVYPRLTAQLFYAERIKTFDFARIKQVVDYLERGVSEKRDGFRSRRYGGVEKFETSSLIGEMMEKTVPYRGVVARFGNKPKMFRYVEAKFDASFPDKKTLATREMPYVSEENLEALIKARNNEIDIEAAEDQLLVDKGILDAYLGNRAAALGYKDAKDLRRAIGVGMSIGKRFQVAFSNKATKTIAFQMVRQVIDYVEKMSPLQDDENIETKIKKPEEEGTVFSSRMYKGVKKFDATSLVEGMLKREIPYKGIAAVFAGRPDMLGYVEEKTGAAIPEKDTPAYTKKIHFTKESLDALIKASGEAIDPETDGKYLRIQKAVLLEYLSGQATRLGYKNAKKLSNDIQKDGIYPNLTHILFYAPRMKTLDFSRVKEVVAYLEGKSSKSQAEQQVSDMPPLASYLSEETHRPKGIDDDPSTKKEENTPGFNRDAICRQIMAGYMEVGHMFHVTASTYMSLRERVKAGVISQNPENWGLYTQKQIERVLGSVEKDRSLTPEKFRIKYRIQLQR